MQLEQYNPLKLPPWSNLPTAKTELILFLFWAVHVENFHVLSTSIPVYLRERKPERKFGKTRKLWWTFTKGFSATYNWLNHCASVEQCNCLSQTIFVEYKHLDKVGHNGPSVQGYNAIQKFPYHHHLLASIYTLPPFHESRNASPQ